MAQAGQEKLVRSVSFFVLIFIKTADKSSP